MVKVVTDKNAAIGLMIVALVFLGTDLLFSFSLHGQKMFACCILQCHASWQDLLLMLSGNTAAAAAAAKALFANAVICCRHLASPALSAGKARP